LDLECLVFLLPFVSASSLRTVNYDGIYSWGKAVNCLDFALMNARKTIFLIIFKVIIANPLVFVDNRVY